MAGKNVNLLPIPNKYWFWQAGIFVVFVVFMLGVLPPDIALQQWALAYTNFMAEWVPMLIQIRKIPGFDPYVQFYYACMWAVVPLLAIGMIAKGFTRPEVENKKIQRLAATWTFLLSAFLFCNLCLVMVLVWPVHAGQNSWRDQSLVSNAFGMGKFGLITLWSITFWCAYLYVICERIANFFALWRRPKR